MEKKDVLTDVIHPFFTELVGVYLKAYERADEFSGVDRQTALRAIKEASDIIARLVEDEKVPADVYNSITVDLINLYARLMSYQGS